MSSFRMHDVNSRSPRIFTGGTHLDFQRFLVKFIALVKTKNGFKHIDLTNQANLPPVGVPNAFCVENGFVLVRVCPAGGEAAHAVGILANKTAAVNVSAVR